MRRCSDLRTELGNARSDARFVEYAAAERIKAETEKQQEEVTRLKEKVSTLEKEASELKEKTEHQIRLLKSQQEGELVGLKNEARIASERCAELAKHYQAQVEDIRAACAREVKFIETKLGARVEELTAELTSVRTSAKAAEEHHAAQQAEATTSLHRIEADFKERIRASEQRFEELRKSHETQLEQERSDKLTAIKDLHKSNELLTVALADKDEVLHRFNTWSGYVLSHLDTFYTTFVDALPDLATEPVDPSSRHIPGVYAPRAVLEDAEAKLTVERVVYRLLQLKQIKSFNPPVNQPSSTSNASAGFADTELTQLAERQERLQRAIRETESAVEAADASLRNALTRLYFFSDNVQQALAQPTQSVIAPMRNVVFVCLAIPNGAVLWNDDPATMRTAVSLLFHTVRVKMSEYGGYECFSDTVAMLVAFDDAVAACRFCSEAQEWLLRLPWPTALSQSPLAKEESSSEHRPLFRGLRVAMAMHAGEAFAEPTCIPAGASDATFRSRYYGRAVSQLVHVASLTQGGQILVTKPAWGLCVQRRHELGQLIVSDLGSFPIISFNSKVGSQEKQMVKLLQILPQSLRERMFRPTAKLEIPAVSPLSGVTKGVFATEIEAIETRRAALNDALGILKEEFSSIHVELRTLLTRARTAKAHFHLLPPPEMVTQLNDLYGVLEKVAIRAEEMRADLQQLASLQEDLEVQGNGLKEYFRQQALTGAREEDLRTEVDLAQRRTEDVLKELTTKHRREVEKLLLGVQERDQTIRKLCQRTANTGEPAALQSAPGGASIMAKAGSRRYS